MINIISDSVQVLSFEEGFAALISPSVRHEQHRVSEWLWW
jgi:hypothetical protein